MLISYPVLPASAIDDDEDKYLDNILNGYVIANEGTYPVSSISTPSGPIHRWHGGIHMRGSGEPIRAIADGTVVAYRFAPACETYEGQGDYDTSFVLIHHQTETGENTKVEFYSLYMHLANRQDLYADRYSQLPAWMKQTRPSTAVRKPNQKIWRKDVLGFAGKLYNHEAWHFEIFTTDDAFNRFWRDSLSVSQGCGSDDFFGDSHFVIPMAREFVARHPRAAQQGSHSISLDGQAHYELALGQDGSADDTLYVSVSWSKGVRITTTHTFDKTRNKYVPLGLPVQQQGYEYGLYRLSAALYPDCPSAGYEWLRCGRAQQGPDRTARNENWQLVRFAADKTGYVDLAPDDIVKLSDADFPFFRGWTKHASGSLVNSNDGLCTDESVISLTQAGDGDSRRQLRHLVCKQPSEWDASDLATRYAALRSPGQPLQVDTAWSTFEQHVGKLAFWAEAGLAERNVWHFHPLQFIRQYRGCGWLSQAEFTQTVPDYAIRTQTSHHQTVMLWERVRSDLHGAQSLAVAHRVPLNKAMRKYGIDTPMRRACFFGNALQETGWLGSLAESRGDTLWYAPWYGRGFLQLTNPGNYCDYWAWRGRHVDPALRRALVAAYDAIQHMPAGHRSNERLRDEHFPALTPEMIQWRAAVEAGNTRQHAGTQAPSPQVIAEDRFAPSDSAGFYWVKNLMAQYADERHVLERCAVQTDHGQKVYYRSPAFWHASAAVNLPGAIQRTNFTGINGFDSRCCAYDAALLALSEVRFADSSGRSTIEALEGYQRRSA